MTKDPIEYLKTAHTNGDTINPETMLRECFGITKTERVVVEWSEVKREIKVGDKVRIIGDASFSDQSKYIGEIKTVVNIDHGYEAATYDIGPFGNVESFWFPSSSVELV